MGKFAAVDHSVLEGYVADKGMHREAVQALRRNGFEAILTPTVLAELELTQGAGGAKERYGVKAIRAVKRGTFRPHCIPDADVEIIDSKVGYLFELGVFENAVLADLLVLVEAAYARCDFLLTTRRSLTSAAPSRVREALIECRLHPVTIRRPS